MKKNALIVFLAAFCLFFSCGESITKMKMPAYSIREYSPKIDPDYPTWITYEVSIFEKCNPSQLSLIAANLRKNTDIKHSNLEIKYYLSESDVVYATSFWDNETAETKLRPEEEDRQENSPADSVATTTKIEPEQAPTEASRSPSIDGEILGRFRDQWGIYTIYKTNGKYYIDNKFVDGSGSQDALETKTRNNQLTFNVVGDPYEFYVMKNGKLYVYDDAGNLGGVYEGI